MPAFARRWQVRDSSNSIPFDPRHSRYVSYWQLATSSLSRNDVTHVLYNPPHLS